MIDIEMLALQRDALRDALKKLLAAHAAKVTAQMSFDKAISSFSNASRERLTLRATRAALTAAELEASVLLLTLKG